MSIVEIFSLDPMKNELHDLLAAIAERRDAEDKLEAHLTGNLDHSEIDLRNTLQLDRRAIEFRAECRPGGI